MNELSTKSKKVSTSKAKPSTAKKKKKQSRPKLTTDELVELVQPRLRILVICLSHSWGGLEQIALEDSVLLAKQGLKVRFLCLDGSPVYSEIDKHPEIDRLVLGYRPRDFMDLRLRTDLNRLIDVEGINLIHLHQTTLLATVVPWVWNRKDLVICASRHIMNNHNKKNFFHSLLYRRVDSLIVMSESLKRNVLETHSLRERQVKIIRHGLDFDAFDPNRVTVDEQREEWGADPETTVIGIVGRIDPAKGQAVFIKAAAGLMKYVRDGKKLKFVVVGEQTRGGKKARHLEELENLIKTFHLEQHVVFSGFKENIPRVMRSLDIFVMPSRQEAFGLVAIEAMAMECPIVISTGGSADEIVGREDYGLLVRPEDAFDLQGKLRFLLEHPELRKKMGRAARAHVIEKYSQGGRLQDTLELYHRMLRRRGN